MKGYGIFSFATNNRVGVVRATSMHIKKDTYFFYFGNNIIAEIPCSACYVSELAI